MIVQVWNISHVMLTKIDVLVRIKQLFKSCVVYVVIVTQ